MAAIWIYFNSRMNYIVNVVYDGKMHVTWYKHKKYGKLQVMIMNTEWSKDLLKRSTVSGRDEMD